MFSAALSLAQSIFAPVAFSLFIIAIAWPFQNWLQAKDSASCWRSRSRILVILVIITVLGWLMIWGFSKIGQWLINNAVRFQIMYSQATEWLEGHGISLASQIVDNFNFGWVLRAVQEVIGRLHNMTSFVVITFVFVLLGMLEVDDRQAEIARLRNQAVARSLLQAGTEIAAKFQQYMLVRSVMSFLTGTVIWGCRAGRRPGTGDGLGRHRLRRSTTFRFSGRWWRPCSRPCSRSRSSSPGSSPSSSSSA